MYTIVASSLGYTPGALVFGMDTLLKALILLMTTNKGTK